MSASKTEKKTTPFNFKTIASHLGIIAGIIFLTYFITLTAQFAFNDEYLKSITSTQINDENFLGSLWLPAMFKPLTQPWLRLSFFLDYKSFGFEPSWYHLVNMILHIASCSYFYLLILLLGREIEPGDEKNQLPYWIAFISAVLLACHPLCVESVAYITGRGGTLVACNVFLSLFCFVFAFFAQKRRDMILSYLTSIVFLCMGIWSGAGATIAPLAMLSLTLLLKPKSLDWQDWLDERGAEICLAAIFLVPMPFLLFMGVSKDFSNGLGLPTLPIPLYIASQLRAIPVYYLRCFTLPFGLSVLPPHVTSKGSLDTGTLLGLIIVCVTIYLIYKLRKNLFACFGLCLFLFGLLPDAFLVQPEIASDRRFYLSVAGLCLLIGQYLAHKLPNKNVRSYAFLALPIVVLGSLSIWRNYAWSTEIRLWRSTLKTNPHSAFVHGMLAQAYLHAHDSAKAKTEAEAAIKTDSDCLPAHFTLAQIYAQGRGYEQASKEYSRVLELAQSQHLDTNFVYQSKLGLAEALVELGQFKQAKPYIDSVLEVNSKNILGNLLMGKCLIQLKQPLLALRYLEAGYNQDKMNNFFLEPIAEACLDTGEPRLVRNAYGAASMAFKIQPTDRVDKVLAKSSLEIGMPGEGLQPVERLLIRHPNSPTYLYLKSRLLEALGRKKEAQHFRRKALKLDANVEKEADIVDARPGSNQ